MSDKKPDLNERTDLFIAQYQAQYSDAITNAREAAATTSTPAWLASYKRNMEHHREIVTNHVKTITYQCDTIKQTDTAEDFEKDIRDAVKGLAEERVRFSAWRTRAVNSYEEAAEKCQTLRVNVQRLAEESEKNNPLIDRGLAEQVRKRIESWPRAVWNDDRGTVEISEPSSDAMADAA